MAEDSRKRAAVLATPELLENILLRVDMRTLLISAQRVCRHWHTLIRTSPLLQQALYLRAAAAAAAAADPTPTTTETATPSTKNPLLAELFPPWFHTGEEYTMMDETTIPNLAIGKRTSAFYRNDASWRRMQVRQPPVTLLGEWKRSRGPVQFDGLQLTRYPRGLRMDDLYALGLKYSSHADWCCEVGWGRAQFEGFDFFSWIGVDYIRDKVEEFFDNAEVVVAVAADDLFCRCGCDLVNGVVDGEEEEEEEGGQEEEEGDQEERSECEDMCEPIGGLVFEKAGVDGEVVWKGNFHDIEKHLN